MHSCRVSDLILSCGHCQRVRFLVEEASININIARLGYRAADGTGFGMNPRGVEDTLSVDVVFKLTLLEERKEMKGNT